MSNSTLALPPTEHALRSLLDRRTVLRGAPVDAGIANAVVTQLLHLASGGRIGQAYTGWVR